jgi:mono/diheme cytochrome c family protein
MQANKNGFFYVIDRESGRFISAKPYTTVTWATGVDANGRPIENSEARAKHEPAIVQPSPEGGHNWQPLSFNPSTGLVYFAVLDDAFMHAIDRNSMLNPHDATTGWDTHYAGPVLMKWLSTTNTRGRLVAWDPVSQTEAWHADLPLPRSGGTLTTAGNLVFQGRADGKVTAYRATTGEALWNFDAGVGIAAAPMTYEIDGTQYVAVLAGWGGSMVLYNLPAGQGKVGFGKLLVFALDGTDTLPKYERPPAPVPMPEVKVAASTADLAEGAALYGSYCQRCHGGAVVSGGSVLDLRYAETYIHNTFQDIVRGGARRQFGMPSFAEDLTDAQVRQIQAYILQRSRESAAAAPTH